MLRIVLALSLAAALSGCATKGFNLTDVAGPARYDVSVVDARPDVSRKGGKGRLFDVYFYHGDELFTPSRVEVFKAAVSEAYEKPPQQVVLRRFDVMDFYEKRLRETQRIGAAAVAASVTGVYVSPEEPTPVDSVLSRVSFQPRWMDGIFPVKRARRTLRIVSRPMCLMTRHT